MDNCTEEWVNYEQWLIYSSHTAVILKSSAQEKEAMLHSLGGGVLMGGNEWESGGGETGFCG